MSNSSAKVDLSTQFVDMTDLLQEDIKKIAHEQIGKLTNSYFKSILQKPDAQIRLRLYMAKNKQGKFEGKFNAELDGDQFYRDTDVPFKEPFDVVSHAFKHLKEHLAKK